MLFNQAVYQIVKVSRVLKLYRGSYILIGMGGTGRNTISRIAAFMTEIKIFSIEYQKNYKEIHWKEDLKVLIRMAGAKQTPTLFLINDTQLANKAYIEDINFLLVNGHVPNMFTVEDYDQIFYDLKTELKERGIFQSRTETLQLFHNLIKQNLHLGLLISPVGDKLRNIVRNVSGGWFFGAGVLGWWYGGWCFGGGGILGVVFWGGGIICGVIGGIICVIS